MRSSDDLEEGLELPRRLPEADRPGQVRMVSADPAPEIQHQRFAPSHLPVTGSRMRQGRPRARGHDRFERIAVRTRCPLPVGDLRGDLPLTGAGAYGPQQILEHPVGDAHGFAQGKELGPVLGHGLGFHESAGGFEPDLAEGRTKPAVVVVGDRRGVEPDAPAAFEAPGMRRRLEQPPGVDDPPPAARFHGALLPVAGVGEEELPGACHDHEGIRPRESGEVADVGERGDEQRVERAERGADLLQPCAGHVGERPVNRGSSAPLW